MGKRVRAKPPAVHPNVAKALQGALDNAQFRMDTAKETGQVLPQKSLPITPREAISRWYENTPGGFDEAVRLSQKSLQDSPPQGAYGNWSPEHLDHPAHVMGSAPGLDEWTMGSAREGVRVNDAGDGLENTIEVRKGKPGRRESVIDHEATHALLDGERLDGNSPIARGLLDHLANDSPPNEVVQQTFRDADAPVWREALDTHPANELIDPLTAELLGQHAGLNPRFVEYLARQSEVDPRMAEIRRRYAWETGNHVKNTEDAAKAWDWWRDNQDHWHSSQTDRPTMEKAAFGLYDIMPDDAKRRMLLRMTQVPAILGGLMGAASQEGQQ